MTEETKTEMTEEELAEAASTFNLNVHMHRLLIDEPFFAALSRRMDKRSMTGIPTAGVRVTEEGKLELVYNPKFFEGPPSRRRKTHVLTKTCVFLRVFSRYPGQGSTGEGR